MLSRQLSSALRSAALGHDTRSACSVVIVLVASVVCGQLHSVSAGLHHLSLIGILDVHYYITARVTFGVSNINTIYDYLFRNIIKSYISLLK